jgi:hypothetical protein
MSLAPSGLPFLWYFVLYYIIGPGGLQETWDYRGAGKSAAQAPARMLDRRLFGCLLSLPTDSFLYKEILLNFLVYFAKKKVSSVACINHFLETTRHPLLRQQDPRNRHLPDGQLAVPLSVSLPLF